MFGSAYRLGYTKAGRPRTRNVTFPSLKKYVSCRTNESSSVACLPLGVLPSSDNPERLLYRAPNLSPGSPKTSEVVGDMSESLGIGSENVESNEMVEAALE